MNHNDYIDGSFRIFGLHGIDDKGNCNCGNKQCKAIFKHPRASSWQHTPHWSDEQLDTMEQMGQFDTGFGVLVDNHIIIDIDPRNGGEESYEKLCKDTGIDFIKESTFVVKTGGGGHHIYFNRPIGSALVSHHNDYVGVDFKSSGYVVGCGSMHASGLLYEALKGHPSEVGDAPLALIDLLKKPERYRAVYDGSHIDISHNDIRDMLQFYKNDNVDYEEWIRCGMAIHDATNGEGFGLWDEWSNQSDKYDSSMMNQKWHSFGKSSNLVTIGTLIHHAEQYGYTQSVVFTEDSMPNIAPPTEENFLDVSDVDILRPPSFVGEVTAWINNQCRFPREHLAVAAALSAIGNIAGLRFEDETYGVTSNQFIFCVAGSATGKEAIQQAQSQLHRVAGMSPATHGTIKSEQEIVRNLTDHQPALYIIDEMGLVLQKIQNARLRGGAAYLEGVVGTLMSAYSKASSFLLLSGDVRKEIKKALQNELKACTKRLDENDDEGGKHQRRAEELVMQLQTLDTGLERPFLSLIGFTTPVTFNSLVDYEQSANGFFGRALVVQEKDTNPKAKKRFKPVPMSPSMSMTLMNLANGGNMDTEVTRIQHLGKRTMIPTDKSALELLDLIEEHYHDYADSAKEATLEAVPRRAFELVLKVSLILAIPCGVRTVEHVRWAFAFVERDIAEKINLAASNMAQVDKRLDEALARRVIAMLDTDHGETTGVIANRCRPVRKEDVERTLGTLKQMGKVRCVETIHARNKTKTEHWYSS
jgi:hypothetical protein